MLDIPLNFDSAPLPSILAPISVSRMQLAGRERRDNTRRWKPRAGTYCWSVGRGVVQLVRTFACHAGDRGFESRSAVTAAAGQFNRLYESVPRNAQVSTNRRGTRMVGKPEAIQLPRRD